MNANVLQLKIKLIFVTEFHFDCSMRLLQFCSFAGVLIENLFWNKNRELEEIVLYLYENATDEILNASLIRAWRM